MCTRSGAMRAGSGTGLCSLYEHHDRGEETEEEETKKRNRDSDRPRSGTRDQRGHWCWKRIREMKIVTEQRASDSLRLPILVLLHSFAK